MLIVCQNKIHRVDFCKRFKYENIICVVADANEVDKSLCGCEFFFSYVAYCWQQTCGEHPNNFVILEKELNFDK